MKQSLLNKTLRIYILFSLAVLLITAPLFFILTERIQLEEADEALLLRLHEFQKFNLATLKESDIKQWNAWNRDIRIENPKRPIHGNVFLYGYYPNIMDKDHEPYRVLKAPIQIEGRSYIFFAKVNLMESEDTLYAVFMLYVSIIVLLFAGLYVMTRWYSLRLWKPFHQLLAQLELFELNNATDINYPPTRIHEFQRLNKVVEDMLTRIVDIYRNQKEFMENAAHELQTPLAVMRAKIDNLMQQPLSQNQSEVLETLNHSVDRLNYLNRNLLLLVRIEGSSYPEKKDISVNEIVVRQLDALSEQLEFYDIKTHIDLKNEIVLHTNPDLLEICISNLLVNAIRYNAEHGLIDITMEQDTLNISNDGHLQPLDADKLFVRFYKAGNSAQGTGLGLSIVKRIAELNGWQILYAFKNKKHVFTLKFR